MTGATSFSGTVTDPALGGLFPNPNYWYNKGGTTVTYTIEDCSGAIQTHTFTVTVLDDEPAEITCPDFPIELTTSSDGAGDCEVCTFSYVGFADDYAPANWTTSFQDIDGTGGIGCDGTAVFAGSSSLTMTSNNNGDDSDVTTCITITSSRILSFDWQMLGFDSYDNPYYDPFGYILDGVYTQVTVDSGSGDLSGTGQTLQSGSVSIPVLAGQEFCFVQATTDGILGSGVTLSNMFVLELPSELVPEVSDNCPDYVLESDLQECYGPGEQSITWTVTDCGGNISELSLIHISEPTRPY